MSHIKCFSHSLGVLTIALFVHILMLLPIQSLEAANIGERFGDWMHECEAVAPNKTNCFISQTQVMKESGKLVVSIVMGKLGADRQPGILVTVPISIFLPSGVVAKIDEGKQFDLLLQKCFPAGCRATAALTTAQLRALKSGNKIFIAYKNTPRAEPIVLPVSLKGVTAGFAAIGM
ncbi:MAG: invasion associated locus B family protein [Magnetococcales bacterium]|nr:invasion associated locus B family protein [Magnetococcales bacterium]